MEVLHHVWELEEATVAQVQERILEKRKVAYTTIMTVMKNLYQKGYLDYRKRGVTYVYKARRKPAEVKHNIMQNLMDKVFKGSPSEMFQTLVENEQINEEERKALERIIRDMK